jgi:sugar phosphate permease
MKSAPKDQGRPSVAEAMNTFDTVPIRIADTMVGPFSYLAGTMTLDFGGKHGAATSSGIIDGVGYLGGVLSGDAVARISLAAGWQGAFMVLGVVTAFSTLAAAFFLLLQRRPATPATNSVAAS